MERHGISIWYPLIYDMFAFLCWSLLQDCSLATDSCPFDWRCLALRFGIGCLEFWVSTLFLWKGKIHCQFTRMKIISLVCLPKNWQFKSQAWISDEIFRFIKKKATGPLQEVGLLIDSAIQWIASLGHQKCSGTKNGGIVPYKAVLGMGLPFHI